ncbi:hypothetical protein FKM82_014579 [Ascaphus truei]
MEMNVICSLTWVSPWWIQADGEETCWQFVKLPPPPHLKNLNFNSSAEESASLVQRKHLIPFGAVVLCGMTMIKHICRRTPICYLTSEFVPLPKPSGGVFIFCKGQIR